MCDEPPKTYSQDQVRSIALREKKTLQYHSGPYSMLGAQKYLTQTLSFLAHDL